MQITEKQYQSLNISASPGFSTAQGRENERRGWTKETYAAKNKEPGNRYDWSRKHLNFEITSVAVASDKRKKKFERKIIPLGSQVKSLKERYESRLDELHYSPFKEGVANQPNTCVDFVFSGDHDRMTEIAFGKPMDFDWEEDNSDVTLVRDPDNPNLAQIEKMALDYYDFLCRKFGEENVIGFECHLDETTPHFHALVVPVALKEEVGKKGGYELKDCVKEEFLNIKEKINSRDYSRLSAEDKILYRPSDGYYKSDDNGNAIVEYGRCSLITVLEYGKLPEEEKSRYRQMERRMVPSVYYAHYFGKTKYDARRSYKQWHTTLHDEVGDKWGLDRGEDTSLMTLEELKEHRKKNKRRLQREAAALAKKNKEEEKKIEKAREERLKEERDLDTIKAEKEKAKFERDAALYEKDQAEELRDTATSEANKAVAKKENALQQLNTVNQEVEVRQGELDGINTTISIRATTLHNVNSEIENTTKNLGKAKSELKSTNEKLTRANNEVTSVQKKKQDLLNDIDVLADVKNIARQNVDDYVKDLSHIEFVVSEDVRKKMVSPLKNNPRVTYKNPALTVEELERISNEEIEKSFEKASMFKKSELLKKVRDILTDKQTILRDVVGKTQMKGIEEANKKIYQEIRRKYAEIAKKADKYDELIRKGISERSYNEVLKERDAAQEKARRLPITEEMLDVAWPGLRKAKDVLVNPELDDWHMNDEQRKIVLDSIREDPKHGIKDILDILKYALWFRPTITLATRTDAIMLATETGVKELQDKGVDLIKDATAIIGNLAEELGQEISAVAERAAHSAVCLFYNYLDAATTISESGGGGGGNITELTGWDGRKKDEDDKVFAGRCLNAAIGMNTSPKQIQEKSKKRGGGRGV